MCDICFAATNPLHPFPGLQRWTVQPLAASARVTDLNSQQVGKTPLVLPVAPWISLLGLDWVSMKVPIKTTWVCLVQQIGVVCDIQVPILREGGWGAQTKPPLSKLGSSSGCPTWAVWSLTKEL